MAIPDSVTNIGSSAFSSCTGLTSVTIPDSVTSIEYGTFHNCENLISVTIPDSVRSIGISAFYDCYKLTSVTIPNNVVNIEEWTFYYCKNLTSVEIPESVTSIGKEAFYHCDNLTSVTIENPDCEIYDSTRTISNGYTEIYNTCFNGTIYGYENSTAQAYAEKYGYQFESLGTAPDTTEPQTENLIKGDADGSGEVDILDVISMNKAIMGKEALTENGLKAIDFNGNGKADSSEVTQVLQYIVGLIEEF